RFYNTLTTNCTTTISTHSHVNPGYPPMSWKVLLSGYVPRYAYDLGKLDGTLPFPELERRVWVNDRAHAAARDPAFSQRIREVRSSLISQRSPRPRGARGESGEPPAGSPDCSAASATTARSFRTRRLRDARCGTPPRHRSSGARRPSPAPRRSSAPPRPGRSGSPTGSARTGGPAACCRRPSAAAVPQAAARGPDSAAGCHGNLSPVSTAGGRCAARRAPRTSQDESCPDVEWRETPPA